jgi:hypothetical protein
MDRPKQHELLAILRAHDHFRFWNSLDDERVCVVCDRRFSGHDIHVACNGTSVTLNCPTTGCDSKIHQWVNPDNPVTSESAYADWWRALSTPEGSELHPKSAG